MRDTLLGATASPTRLTPVWQLAQAWERGDFEAADVLGRRVGVPVAVIAQTYRQALEQASALQAHGA